VIDRLTRRFGAWLMAAMGTPRSVNIRAVRITTHWPQRTASRLAAVVAAADALMPSTGFGPVTSVVVCRVAAVSVGVPPWNLSSSPPRSPLRPARPGCTQRPRPASTSARIVRDRQAHGR